MMYTKNKSKFVKLGILSFSYLFILQMNEIVTKKRQRESHFGQHHTSLAQVIALSAARNVRLCVCLDVCVFGTPLLGLHGEISHAHGTDI